MLKDIEPKLKKIGEYLKLPQSVSFHIPEYQRPYSWTIDQCDKLWQDVLDFDGAGDYFLGTIIIDCGNAGHLSLIDGQQRTTTFVLLLKGLLIKIVEALAEIPRDDEHEGLVHGLKSERDDIIGLLYRAESDSIPALLKMEDFSKAASDSVIANESINEEYKAEVRNILSAKDFDAAEGLVHKMPRRQKDNRYTNYFRNFKFFCEKMKEMHSPALYSFAKKFLKRCELIEIRSWNMEQAITMFNSLNSDGLPLSDADIISAKLYKESGENGKRKEFGEQWEMLLESAEKLKSEKIATLDAIFMQHMYIKRARDKEYIRDGNVPDVTVPGLRSYYTNKKNGLLGDPLALCGALRSLADIWLLAKDYSVVKLALKFNSNIRYYMAGFFSRHEKEANPDKSDIERFCLCLVRLFAVYELVETGYSSAKFKTFLFQANVKLVDGGVCIDEIERDFSAHIAQNWDRGGIRESLMEYSKNILVYLNEYLFAPERFSLAAQCDVEHIMPASGRNIAQIRTSAGIDGAEEFRELANRIGNKILLEAGINRAVGNDWFKTKTRSPNGYPNSKFAIAQDLAKTYGGLQEPLWRKADIESATSKAADRIVGFIFGGPRGFP